MLPHKRDYTYIYTKLYHINYISLYSVNLKTISYPTSKNGFIWKQRIAIWDMPAAAEPQACLEKEGEEASHVSWLPGEGASHVSWLLIG